MVVTPSNSLSLIPSLTPQLSAQYNTAANSQPFSKQLDTALEAARSSVTAQSPATTGVTPSAALASTSPQILSVTILPWGPSIAYAPAAAPAASVTPLPPATTNVAAAGSARAAIAPAVDTKPPAVPLPASQQAINALSDILTSYGINPATLGLSYSEQVVAGPTGTYTNKMITAKFPSGKSQDYSADLTLKNPLVAAVEIMGMLGRRIVA